METEVIEKKYRIPWWLYLLAAVLGYCIFHYILPSLATTESGMAQFLGLAPELAPIVAIVFLLLCANALYRDDPSPESKKEKKPPQEDPPFQ